MLYSHSPVIHQHVVNAINGFIVDVRMLSQLKDSSFPSEIQLPTFALLINLDYQPLIWHPCQHECPWWLTMPNFVHLPEKSLLVIFEVFSEQSDISLRRNKQLIGRFHSFCITISKSPYIIFSPRLQNQNVTVGIPMEHNDKINRKKIWNW